MGSIWSPKKALITTSLAHFFSVLTSLLTWAPLLGAIRCHPGVGESKQAIKMGGFITTMTPSLGGNRPYMSMQKKQETNRKHWHDMKHKIVGWFFGSGIPRFLWNNSLFYWVGYHPLASAIRQGFGYCSCSVSKKNNIFPNLPYLKTNSKFAPENWWSVQTEFSLSKNGPFLWWHVDFRRGAVEICFVEHHPIVGWTFDLKKHDSRPQQKGLLDYRKYPVVN